MGRLLRSSIYLAIIIFVTVGSSSATTYYVATSGSDSNNGTSESTPWGHLPGMLSWTGSHTPVAGDTYILRGCDVWANANFPITWNWSGTSGNPITIDRDTTWYNTANCATTWNRAIFDPGGAAIHPPECTNLNFIIVFNSAMYVNVNWVEVRNFFWNSDQNNACFGTAGFADSNRSDWLQLNNWYVHKWTAGASAKDSDNMIRNENANPLCGNCMLTGMVFDNSDGNGNSGVGIRWSMQNSIVHDAVNVIKPLYNGTWANNNIYNIRESFDGISHPNCIETIGVLGGTGVFYFHDNYIHDVITCEGGQVGNPGEVDYMWNNIWVMGGGEGSNGPQVPQSSPSKSLYFWNNTLVNTLACINQAGHGGTYTGDFEVNNNHCINTSTGTATNGSFSASGKFSTTNNVDISAANATSQGYTDSEAHVYSPLNGTCNNISTNCAIGAGLNLTASWPAGFSTNDTAYSCVEQTVNTVVQSVCNQRTPNPRPTGTTAWDAGAYYWSTSTSTAPNPPTNVQATVK